MGTEQQEPREKRNAPARVARTLRDLTILSNTTDEFREKATTKLQQDGAEHKDVNKLATLSEAMGRLKTETSFIKALQKHPDISDETLQSIIHTVMDAKEGEITAEVSGQEESPREAFEQLTEVRDDEKANPKLALVRDMMNEKDRAQVAEVEFDSAIDAAIKEGVPEEVVSKIVRGTAEYMSTINEITLLQTLSQLPDAEQAQELWKQYKTARRAQADEQLTEPATPPEEATQHSDPLEAMLETQSEPSTQLNQKSAEELRILDAIESSGEKIQERYNRLVAEINNAVNDPDLGYPTEESELADIVNIVMTDRKLHRDHTVGLHDRHWINALADAIDYDGKDPQKAQFILDLWTRKQEQVTEASEQPRDDDNNS